MTALQMNSSHPFDEATALQWQGDGATGHWLGDPVSLTINFCAAVADGEFSIQTRPARTNRSTQHWVIEMLQGGETVLTATALTAVRRTTHSLGEATMPGGANARRNGVIPAFCTHAVAQAL